MTIKMTTQGSVPKNLIRRKAPKNIPMIIIEFPGNHKVSREIPKG